MIMLKGTKKQSFVLSLELLEGIFSVKSQGRVKLTSPPLRHPSQFRIKFDNYENCLEAKQLENKIRYL